MRKLYLAAALICAVFLWAAPCGEVAYADGAEIPEPPPETTASEAKPFTPAGTGTVVDNATDGDGKEFFTIITPAENVFYLIIDHQRETKNVYFLNAVTESDLLALAEQPEETAETVSAIPDIPITTTPTPEPAPAPEPEPEPTPELEQGGGLGMLILVALAVVAGGGVGYYFKIYRPKQQQADAEDEYDYEADTYIEDVEPEDDGRRGMRTRTRIGLVNHELHRQPAGTDDEANTPAQPGVFA